MNQSMVAHAGRFVLGMFGSDMPIGPRFGYDIVIANSFGTVTAPGSVNAHIRFLGDQAAYYNGVPIVMDRMLTACPDSFGVTPDEALVVGGPISDWKGGGVGTWGVLEHCVNVMRTRGLSSPLLIGHAAHVHRIALQAYRLGMNPIVHGGMPRSFDRDSTQFWTTRRSLWLSHELAGSVYLKIKGRL